jgi:hypothetical protein
MVGLGLWAGQPNHQVMNLAFLLLRSPKLRSDPKSNGVTPLASWKASDLFALKPERDFFGLSQICGGIQSPLESFQEFVVHFQNTSLLGTRVEMLERLRARI